MKFKKIIFIIIIMFVILFGSLILILNSFFQVNLTELSGSGELQETYISPDGKYQADLFLINKGGATVDFQERVSITSLTDNKREFDDETIYWLYPANDDTFIEWRGNNKIAINNKIIFIKDPDSYYNWKKDND